MMNTERLIKHAVQENLSITVCINKVYQFSIHRLVNTIHMHEKLIKLNYLPNSESEPVAYMLTRIVYFSSK